MYIFPGLKKRYLENITSEMSVTIKCIHELYADILENYIRGMNTNISITSQSPINGVENRHGFGFIILWICMEGRITALFTLYPQGSGFVSMKLKWVCD